MSPHCGNDMVLDQGEEEEEEEDTKIAKQDWFLMKSISVGSSSGRGVITVVDNITNMGISITMIYHSLVPVALNVSSLSLILYGEQEYVSGTFEKGSPLNLCEMV